MVYRYLNEQFGLQALQQQKWKIGRLLELNDPLDCQPTLRRSGVTEHMSVGSDPYFANIYDSLGIICYSECINDPVIWSHYADSHRGMAFGFEFGPDEGLFPVHYPEDDSRAVLDYDVLEALKKDREDDALLKVISHGFTQKAKSWAYECEYRHFIFLHGCTMIGPHYFRDMPMPRLRRIVLGVKCRVTESDIRRIKKSWQSPYNIEIVTAQIDQSSYRLKI
jgi:hypothetical protein